MAQEIIGRWDGPRDKNRKVHAMLAELDLLPADPLDLPNFLHSPAYVAAKLGAILGVELAPIAKYGTAAAQIINDAMEAAYAGPAEASSTQWRVLIDQAGTGGIEIRELEFRATPGGADQCVGGVASASSQAGASWAPAKAFNDGADAFPWTPSPQTAGQWIAYTTPGAISVNEILMHNSQQSTGPRGFSIQYHDGDGWVTWWSEAGVVWGGSLQTQIFTKPA